MREIGCYVGELANDVDQEVERVPREFGPGGAESLREESCCLPVADAFAFDNVAKSVCDILGFCNFGKRREVFSANAQDCGEQFLVQFLGEALSVAEKQRFGCDCLFARDQICFEGDDYVLVDLRARLSVRNAVAKLELDCRLRDAFCDGCRGAVYGGFPGCDGGFFGVSEGFECGW